MLIEVLKRNVLLRFLISGGVTTILDFIVYMFLSKFIPISYAKLCSMLCAMSVSFFINKYWSFNDKKSRISKNVYKFFIAQVINITVNIGVNNVFIVHGYGKVIAFSVATLVAMCVNYLLQRYFVFSIQEEKYD